MKRFLSLLLALFTLLAFAGCTAPGPSGTTPTGTAAPGTTVLGTAVPDSTAPDGAHRRVLIVFFSCTGNTRTAALSLQDKTGADLYELVPAVPGADIRDGLRIAAPQDSAIDAWLREAGL